MSLSGSLEQLHSAATENKWAFWNSVKTSLNFGEQIQKLNARVCSYQRERMNAAEAIEGVTLLVGKVQHLPNIIEEAVITAFLEYHIKGIGNVISVDCCESCSHDKGIHIFLEASTDLVEASSNDLSTIIRSTLRDHAPIKEIVFVQASGLSQFCTGTETARFSMRDKFLQKKLNDEILLIDKEDSNDYNEVI